MRTFVESVAPATNSSLSAEMHVRGDALDAAGHAACAENFEGAALAAFAGQNIDVGGAQHAR